MEGAVEAEDQLQAEGLLGDQGMTVLELAEGGSASAFEFRLSFLERVSAKDLVVFSRQLSVMVSADIPIVQGLRILVDQTKNEKLRDALSSIVDDVDGGSKLSDALERHTGIFTEFYINMVRSGETSGKLEEVLSYLADQQERDYDLNAKIKGALTYPIFVVSAMVVIGFLMVTFILPKLTVVLQESSVELPISTKILIAVSNMAQRFWWVFVLLCIIAIFGLRFFSKTKMGKQWLDAGLVYMPMFGALLVRKIYLVRMLRSLSTLLQGGVPLTDSLRMVAEVVSNGLYKDILIKAQHSVEDGNPLATVLLQEKLIPDMIAKLVVIGEQSGRLEVMLTKMSAFYEREIENVVSNLTTILEPMLLLVMGVGVAGLILSIMLPMFKLAQAV